MIGWEYIPPVNFPVPGLPLQEILTAKRFTLGLATASRPFARNANLAGLIRTLPSPGGR